MAVKDSDQPKGIVVVHSQLHDHQQPATSCKPDEYNEMDQGSDDPRNDVGHADAKGGEEVEYVGFETVGDSSEAEGVEEAPDDRQDPVAQTKIAGSQDQEVDEPAREGALLIGAIFSHVTLLSTLAATH